MRARARTHTHTHTHTHTQPGRQTDGETGRQKERDGGISLHHSCPLTDRNQAADDAIPPSHFRERERATEREKKKETNTKRQRQKDRDRDTNIGTHHDRRVRQNKPLSDLDITGHRVTCVNRVPAL